MDLSFNRKSIFRKSFRHRRTSSSIPPAAAFLMKSLNRTQSTRRSMKISSKLMRRNTTDTESNLKSGNFCLSTKTPSSKDDKDELLPKSPILKRQDSISKPLDPPSKWTKTSSPLKHHVSKVVAAMEKTIWNTPKKQVSKLFRRSSSGSFSLSPGGSRMDLGGSYKVLVFE